MYLFTRLHVALVFSEKAENTCKINFRILENKKFWKNEHGLHRSRRSTEFYRVVVLKDFIKSEGNYSGGVLFNKVND